MVRIKSNPTIEFWKRTKTDKEKIDRLLELASDGLDNKDVIT